MSQSPGSCAVLVPVSGSLEPETEQALHVLARRGYAVRTMRGGSQIDLARSQMATEALRDGFEETLWIDSDIAFDPDDVERIRAHSLPLCAGLYLKKDRSGFAAKFRDTGTVRLGQCGGLLEMEYVGTGFLHVRAGVYRAIANGHGFAFPLPECKGGYGGQTVTPYFLPLLVREHGQEELTYLSEDYSFCTRARQAGFSVVADTTIRLGHVGRYSFTWDDLSPRETLLGVELRVGMSDEPPTQPKEEPMSQNLYAMLGQKQERIEHLDHAYDALLGLLGKVVSGEVARSRVLVNLTERSWALAPVGQTPGLPAQMNGVPVCIVAPDEAAAVAPAAA